MKILRVLPPALLIPAFAAAAQDAARQSAELILHDGRIHTMDSQHTVAAAIAIGGGRVLATGPLDAVLRRASERTRFVDLDGRTVIPGLNDSHSHVVRGGRFYNLELRWDGVTSLRSALGMVREQARRTPKGQWVRVIGAWSPFQFEERRMPTIQELNEAAPDTPVFVLFLYSKGFLNAAGVRALGITEQTQPPRGSRYAFVEGGAELIAEPNPTILYKTIGALPHLTEEQQVNSTRHFYRELNRFGLTSAIDAGGGGHLYPTNYVATKRLAERGHLPIRISYFLFPQRPDKELEDFQRWTSTYESGADADTVHQNGYVLQGGGEFLAWSAGDFENFMAPRPRLARAMDQRLRAIATLLVKHRWPFRIHATYGESIERILDVFDRVDAEQPFDGLRFVVDHAETIRQEQIERIREFGGGIAIQNRMAFAGEYFIERYGFEAAASAPPLRKLVDSGIPLAAGTDATRVSSHNPWLSLYWMVAGRTVGGTVLYPPQNRLSRDEALQLYTRGSAWLSGEEQLKGTLEPGRFADLAVLSSDYFSVPEESIRSIESVLTIVDGKPVYATDPFDELSRPLPPVIPTWSPVAHFGGYTISNTKD